MASRRALARTCEMAVAILAAATVPASWTGAAAATAGAPYPASTAVPGISFDWGSYRRLAPGSDNWPLTWSADGNQYTSFGDGGGFGGSDVKGRVSLGFGRIEGTAEAYRGRNLWGGVNAATAAKFTGKSYGVLAVGEVLYSWRCGAGSTDAAFDFQQMHRSENNGVTWRPASWQFPRSVPFYCPAFVQYGQGYQGARDGYVYMHASERDNEVWEAHTPGRLMLMRAPKDRLMDRAAYEFFAGRDASGQPRWSARVDDREAVFTDPNGARLPAVVYNAGLNRYLLTVEQAPKGSSNIGIFDAPEPWGPWTTVLYERGWGRGEIDTTAFYYNFSPKWWSNGGRDFVLVFTGSGQLDAWNSVQGSFTAGTGDGGGSGGRAAAGTGAIADGELASTATSATGTTTGSVASRGAVQSTAADATESAITDSDTTSGTRSSRRAVRTSTMGSGASSGGASATGATSSTQRAAQPSVAGGRSTATASTASESSTTQRRTRVDASSAAGTQSSSTTAGSVSATAGTRTSNAARNSDAAASESGQQTRRIVTSSRRSADGTGGTTNTAAAASTTTGSRTTGASATATPATASADATRSAARRSSAATDSSTRARAGVDPASETSSEAAGREETDVDVDTGVGASIPTPAPARSNGGATPSATAVAEPAAVAETPARAAGREGGRAATGSEPAPDAETTVATTVRAADDPAVADVPAPVDERSLEPRLVGIMEQGALRTALVVPAGASQPTAVRTGDRLGSWSVEGVDGQQVAMRSGEQTLVLRLFAAGG